MATKTFTLSDNAKAVMKYLQANQGMDLTAADIADGCGFENGAKTANGVITGLQKEPKCFVIREEAPEKIDGKVVKYIRLTAKGAAVDPEAEITVEVDD